ncbi:MAG: acyl-CoA dehydrogenase family protein [Defluviimonas denitrificans]
MSGLDYERVVLSGIGTGIMAACMDEVMPYLAQRKQFGQPIGSFQLMQGKIADMYTKMNSARAYVYEVARSCDRGEVTPGRGRLRALRFRRAMVVAHQAVQAMGGMGFMNEPRFPHLPRCETDGDRRRDIRDPPHAGRARVDGGDGVRAFRRPARPCAAQRDPPPWGGRVSAHPSGRAPPFVAISDAPLRVAKKKGTRRLPDALPPRSAETDQNL